MSNNEMINTELKDQIFTREIERKNYKYFVREEKVLFYVSPDGVGMPPTIMDKIITQTYTQEDVKKWVLTGDDFNDFPAHDEIRTELLSLIRGEFLNEVLNFKTLEKKTGEELYRNNPIAEYVQQGDVLLFREGEDPKNGGPKKIISFDELSNEMRVRITSCVWYELLESKINIKGGDIKLKFLKMGNASFWEDSQKYHVEMVGLECKSILDAIKFRNGTSLLPYRLS